MVDLFSNSARNKSNKMAKSALKDAFTVVKSRLAGVFR
jgi:hypothetical protein